jgi:hypothetical protein
MIDLTITTFSMKMKKENDFSLVGLGYQRGCDSEKLKAFVLGFIAVNHVNVDEARDLFIGLCEELLDQINANEKMKPWLTDYPYTGKNLNIILAFYQAPSRLISPPYIALVSVLNGNVCYSTHENDKFSDVPVETEVLIETYEEALKIYKENHPEIQNSS